jgi:hypothetical protein
MEDRVADLRARWTPEATAAAVAFLESQPVAFDLPTMEHDGVTTDLRGWHRGDADRQGIPRTSTALGYTPATSASRTRAREMSPVNFRILD